MTRATAWLNENRYRNYPLAEDAPKLFTGDYGQIDLPDDVLLDFQFTSYLRGHGSMELYSLELVAGAPATLVATFRYYEDGTAYTEDIQLTVPENLAAPYRQQVNTEGYTISAVWGEGVADVLSTYVASLYVGADSWLEPALLVFQGHHRVHSLIGDTDDSVAVSGDVYWEDGYSMSIRVREVSQRVVIVASPGAGAGFPCEAQDVERPDCNESLLYINGVYGDAEGKFQLNGGRGIEVIPLPEEHEIVLRTDTEPADIDCKEE